MKKWELKEKFDTQHLRYQDICKRYDAAVIEAGTHIENLKAEQSELLRQEFMTGNDLSIEKINLNEKIAAAEKAKVIAEQERSQAYAYRDEVASSDRITVRDLVLDWSDRVSIKQV